jgi:hypothetical protein
VSLKEKVAVSEGLQPTTVEASTENSVVLISTRIEPLVASTFLIAAILTM